VVVAGQSDALLAVALAAPDPAVVVLRGADGLAADHPAFGKIAGPEGAVAYVCRRNVCGLPIADPAALARALGVRT
jgi:hypothetical protein